MSLFARCSRNFISVRSRLSASISSRSSASRPRSRSAHARTPMHLPHGHCVGCPFRRSTCPGWLSHGSGRKPARLDRLSTSDGSAPPDSIRSLVAIHLPNASHGVWVSLSRWHHLKLMSTTALGTARMVGLADPWIEDHTNRSTGCRYRSRTEEGASVPTGPGNEQERIDLVVSSAFQWLGYIRNEDSTPPAEGPFGEREAKAAEAAENPQVQASIVRFLVDRAVDTQTGLHKSNARTLGLSWQKIGDAMGMTVQGIWARRPSNRELGHRVRPRTRIARDPRGRTTGSIDRCPSTPWAERQVP